MGAAQATITAMVPWQSLMLCHAVGYIWQLHWYGRNGRTIAEAIASRMPNSFAQLKMVRGFLSEAGAVGLVALLLAPAANLAIRLSDDILADFYWKRRGTRRSARRASRLHCQRFVLAAD